MIAPPGVEDERRRLIDEKKRTEDQYEALRLMYDRGELSEQEFQRRRHELERQFVEIMDRIAQMNYLLGE
jgi:RNase P subunit RPR2